MAYTLTRGSFTTVPTSLKMASGGLATMALIAGAIFGSLLFTHNTYSKQGQHPLISPNASSKSDTSANQAASSQSSVPASSSSPHETTANPFPGRTNLSANSSTPNTSGSDNVPATNSPSPIPSGGTGGGTSTTPTEPSPTPSNTTQSVTVPGVSLQADGKEVISTSPVSLTIN